MDKGIVTESEFTFCIHKINEFLFRLSKVVEDLQERVVELEKPGGEHDPK